MPETLTHSAFTVSHGLVSEPAPRSMWMTRTLPAVFIRCLYFVTVLVRVGVCVCVLIGILFEDVISEV